MSIDDGYIAPKVTIEAPKYEMPDYVYQRHMVRKLDEWQREQASVTRTHNHQAIWRDCIAHYPPRFDTAPTEDRLHRIESKLGKLKHWTANNAQDTARKLDSIGANLGGARLEQRLLRIETLIERMVYPPTPTNTPPPGTIESKLTRPEKRAAVVARAASNRSRKA